MINKRKKYTLTTIIVIIILSIVAGLGFSAVHFIQKSEVKHSKISTPSKSSNASQKEEKKKETSENDPTKGSLLELDTKEITEFLKAYYNRKDLGENRARYQTYMTPALYSTVVEQEDDPVAQRLKGLVVNQKYTSSEIYVDQEHKKAICKVYYSNENLDHLPTPASPDPERFTMKNNQNIELSFQKTDEGYLVDSLSYLIFGENTNGK